jgi:hypothetical protein
MLWLLFEDAVRTELAESDQWRTAFFTESSKPRIMYRDQTRRRIPQRVLESYKENASVTLPTRLDTRVRGRGNRTAQSHWPAISARGASAPAQHQTKTCRRRTGRHDGARNWRISVGYITCV